ncbi:hypothetical protein OGAPHI_004919 [Ogataea philodendri]|uniref:amidase n=1 Tax=Ogataea philodendri TaxID=1378263 RepID=A0A9P8P0D2_9ASCO|nr:uncharacterized protein OGAPHI_004919 [Ogataea philodendri]KAH3663518.1 hypothetical protein OGAPHI_004919 [Ogataea philodendri]
MFGTFTNTTEDAKLYATYVPKIEAYRAKLKAGILEEYKLKEELVPKEFGVDVTQIPEQILSKKELAIVNTPGYKLVEEIASGKLTSVEVFKAFAKTATAAHQVTNCAMELFLDEGLKKAEELDEYYEKTGKTVGPLHGLPVSLKEHYNYKGKVTHGACVSRIENITDNWCLTVEVLLEAGAVFYVRTTEPQTIMHLCSNNNITGLCRNPNNTSLTTGGSSSGEGALVAMRGSVFGLGSDIGGSIRCPSAFCGIFGLRPTQKRLSMKNVTFSSNGVGEGVVCVLGPLARSAQDIDLFMKASLGGKPWERDPILIPLPWREVAVPAAKDLKIAIMYDDGVVKPTPPILRGLKVATEKLKAAGATVVEWESFGVLELAETCGAFYNADCNKAQKDALAASGEPVLELSKIAMSFGCGDKGLSATEEHIGQGLRDSHRVKYHDKMAELGVDFILSPTYVSVAAKPETIHYWGYTSLWNILDFPNVVFPTGLKCDPSLDAPDKSYQPRSELEKYEYELYDDAENFKGAPISLQLTGKRWFDEEVVKASQVVHEIVTAKRFQLQSVSRDPFKYVYPTSPSSSKPKTETALKTVLGVGEPERQVVTISRTQEEREHQMSDDELFREYLVTLCKDFRPTTKLNGFNSYMVGVDMSSHEAMLFDSFVKGFMVSVSPQLTHRNLQPGVVFIPPGTTNKALRDIFYACGAAFLCWEQQDIRKETESRFLQCVTQLPALVQSMKSSGDNKWLLIALLCLCLREKYDGHDYLRSAWYLQMALEIIRSWPSMQQKITMLPQIDQIAAQTAPDSDENIELMLDDMSGVMTETTKVLENSERCLLESFLYNYSVILLLCDRATIDLLESPFKVFKEFRPYMNQKLYDCPAPWMNNPVMGAAASAFELAAKTSWLHAKYPFCPSETKLALGVQKMAEYYVAPVLPPSVRFSQPKHVQRKLLDSCCTARVVAKASYLLLTKLINPDLSSEDPKIKQMVQETMKDISELSIHSQTSFIVTWPIAVIGTAVSSKEQRDYLVWRLLNFGYAVRSSCHIRIVEFLKSAWGTEQQPGIGFDVLLNKRYFKGLFL